MEFSRNTISDSFRIALLEEVYTTPKPGLVDCWDTGAHTDMDCTTFEQSAQAITPFLTDMFFTGLTWDNSLPQLFMQIRQIGIDAEKAMFAATKGINTHKGALFTLGILAAASAYVYSKQHDCIIPQILSTCATMTNEILEQEFQHIAQKSHLTHGESLFIRYGERGIRGEAQQGFPVIDWVWHHTQHLFTTEPTTCSRCWHNTRNLIVLLHSMTKLHDTNVVSRTSYTELAWLQKRSADIIAHTADNTLVLGEISAFNTECIKKNISPGGSADILAACILLHTLHNLVHS